MNEEFKEQSKEDGKKSFYSVNLTEGKIILIFVAFVFVIVVGIFGTLIVMSNIGKQDNKVVKEEIKKEENTSSDYNFYSELTGEDVSTVIDTTSDIIKVDDVKKETIVTENSETKKVEGDVEEKSSLDNSEVIYSSKLNEQKEEKKATLKKENTQKEEVAVKKQTKTNFINNSKLGYYTIIFWGCLLSQNSVGNLMKI